MSFKVVFFFHSQTRATLRLVFPFHREVKKNVKLRRQSESQVRLSPSNPKKKLNACCGL